RPRLFQRQLKGLLRWPGVAKWYIAQFGHFVSMNREAHASHTLRLSSYCIYARLYKLKLIITLLSGLDLPMQIHLNNGTPVIKAIPATTSATGLRNAQS